MITNIKHLVYSDVFNAIVKEFRNDIECTFEPSINDILHEDIFYKLNNILYFHDITGCKYQICSEIKDQVES